LKGVFDAAFVDVYCHLKFHTLATVTH